MSRTGCRYDLLEEHRRKPVLLQVDDIPAGLIAMMEVRREPHRWWRTFGYFRKVKLYSLVFGLALTFLIMTSYVLSGDRKRLLLTPSPYHLPSLVSQGPFLFNITTPKDYTGIKLVVKSITSKVHFSARQLPDPKDLIQSEPHVSSKSGLSLNSSNALQKPHWKITWKSI